MSHGTPDRAPGNRALAQVLLVDDHEAVRHGVRGYLDRYPRLAVCGETSAGQECLATARALRPDLALVDLQLPDIDGIEVTLQLRTVSPGTAVVIYSGYADTHLIEAASRAGASGFIPKGKSLEELVVVLEAVLLGQRRFPEWGQVSEVLPRGQAEGPSLTLRENEVLAHVAQGMGPDAIAECLYISKRTVEKHCQHLREKLHLHSHAQLVRYALTRYLGWTGDATNGQGSGGGGTGTRKSPDLDGSGRG